MAGLMRLPMSTPALAGVLSLCGAGAALAARPVAGAHYAGQTAQHHGISFDVSGTGRRLVHPNFYLRTNCLGGETSFADTSAHTTATVSGRIRHGKFALHFGERARLAHHVSARARFTLQGRFTRRRRASGTVSVTVRYSNGAECVSGPVKFSVRS
jgi:hypothetical protein